MNDIFSKEVVSDSVYKSIPFKREAFEVYVSNGLRCKNTPGTKYVVTLQNNNRFWWLKHEFFSVCANQMIKKMSGDVSPPSWFLTNKDTRRRDKPYGPNKYGVRRSGSAHTVITFTLIVYDGGINLKAQVTKMFQTIRSWFVRPNTAYAAGKYVGCLRYTMPNFLKVVEGVDRSSSLNDDHLRSLTRKAEICIRSVTGAPPNIHYGTSLDHFMLDEDIQRFAQSCGYINWNDIDDDLSKRKIFYNSGNLIPWDRIKALPV